MKRTGRNRRNQRGMLLISLFMLLAVISILAVALVTYAVGDVRSSQRAMGSTQGFYLSEAALDNALRWIRTQAGPPAGTARMVLFGGWQQVNDGLYLASVDPDDNNPNSFIKRYTLEGWGVSGTVAQPVASRYTQMIVQTESFSRYAYFTNADTSPTGSNLWFITGDKIEGPMHTNGRFNMYGFPVFNGPVSSVLPSLNLWGGGPPMTSPVFNGGLEMGGPSIPFPAVVPTALKTAAENGGTTFTGNTQITLLANGTMRVTNANQNLNGQVMPLPANGALYVKSGSMSLEGTLRGNLTAGAENDVKITNSVIYSDDPQTNPNSQDVLGIVAGKDVKVASTAPNNVTIQGAVMALGTSFTVENWSAGPPKDTLTVYGGIIQKFRGPVGTFNSSTGQIISGYKKDYHYDQRFQTATPPYFPTTGDYVSLSWEEPR